jgi:hypothetical protein
LVAVPTAARASLIVSGRFNYPGQADNAALGDRHRHRHHVETVEVTVTGAPLTASKFFVRIQRVSF